MRRAYVQKSIVVTFAKEKKKEFQSGKLHIIGSIRPFSTVNQKKIAYHFVYF